MKQSEALNRPEAENMKPRQLSDAFFEEIGYAEVIFECSLLCTWMVATIVKCDHYLSKIADIGRNWWNLEIVSLAIKILTVLYALLKLKLCYRYPKASGECNCEMAHHWKAEQKEPSI